MLQGRMIPCNSREAVITVTSYEKGMIKGFLKHPRLGKKVELYSLSQMVLLLDSLVNMETCPNRPLPLIPSERGGGEENFVFRIQVLFREHFTWQGKLIWENENQEAVFHSVLELLQLMDEILAE